MPEKPRIIRKLKEIGCECHPASLAVKIHDQDAAIMRSSGILLSRLYKNNEDNLPRSATKRSA
jgi:hypothetical protein